MKGMMIIETLEGKQMSYIGKTVLILGMTSAFVLCAGVAHVQTTELADIMNETDMVALGRKLSTFNSCAGMGCLLPGIVVRLNRIEQKLDALKQDRCYASETKQ